VAEADYCLRCGIKWADHAPLGLASECRATDRLSPEDYERAAKAAEHQASCLRVSADHHEGPNVGRLLASAAYHVALAAKLRAAGQAVGR